MPPIIDEEKCTGCGTCASICPMRIFVHEPAVNKVPLAKFAEECYHCLSCEFDCPQKAIKVRLPLPMMMPYVDASTLRPEEGGRHA